MSGPPPGITSLDSYAQGWDEAWYPAGPRAFAKRARAAGWDVRVGFSRGSVPGAKAGTWETRDIIGVWLDGYGRRLAAFWERNPDARFSARKSEAGVDPGEVPSGMSWSSGGGLVYLAPGVAFPYANLREIDAFVAARGEVDEVWWATAKERVLAARERAKAAPASAPKARAHA